MIVQLYFIGQLIITKYFLIVTSCLINKNSINNTHQKKPTILTECKLLSNEIISYLTLLIQFVLKYNILCG